MFTDSLRVETGEWREIEIQCLCWILAVVQEPGKDYSPEGDYR